MWLLQRLGEERGVGELVVLPIQSRLGLGPEPEQHLAGFFKAVQAFSYGVERNPVGRMLIALPGGTQATDEAIARDNVHRRGHFRDDGGMAIGIPDDQSADTQALG